MHLRKCTLAFGLAIGALLMVPAHGEAAARSAPRKGKIQVSDGINYYYEIHGQGKPLLLLHGGLMSIDLLGPVLPAFAKHRQVIAVDLQGHGRTTLGERKIDLVDIGNDLAILLKKLHYDSVDVIGSFIRGQRGLAPGGSASRRCSPPRPRLGPIRARRLVS
jgi:hypothetical protein